jgi:hypothetical protein
VRYRPIPRDRDHAFFKFNDGFFTHIIGWVKSNYQTFEERIRLSDVEGLNRAARPMDKSLLVYLAREDFRQIADSLQQQLSPAVIKDALSVWPREVYGLVGQEFEQKLNSRRAQLPAVADKFYALLSRNVELPGTDQPERFVVDVPAPEQVRVQVYLRHTTRPDSLVDQRTFRAGETSTLKIYGLGGDDVFELRALPPTSISLGCYDGAGQDVVLGPASAAATRTRTTVFDSGDGNTLTLPRAVKVEKYAPAANEFDAAGWLLRHRLY